VGWGAGEKNRAAYYQLKPRTARQDRQVQGNKNRKGGKKKIVLCELFPRHVTKKKCPARWQRGIKGGKLHEKVRAEVGPKADSACQKNGRRTFKNSGGRGFQKKSTRFGGGGLSGDFARQGWESERVEGWGETGGRKERAVLSPKRGICCAQLGKGGVVKTRKGGGLILRKGRTGGLGVI